MNVENLTQLVGQGESDISTRTNLALTITLARGLEIPPNQLKTKRNAIRRMV
jgi:hypothetical protein